MSCSASAGEFACGERHGSGWSLACTNSSAGARYGLVDLKLLQFKPHVADCFHKPPSVPGA